MTAKKSKQLDMAPGAVDDRYTGCRDKAFEKFIKGGLLNEELKLHEDLWEKWHTQEACFQQNPETSKQHLAALKVYDSEDARYITDFNNAVETLGANATTYHQFSYKSFHFLLMDSMRELQPKECMTVHAVASRGYKASKGSKVRLGRFLKAYVNFSFLKKLTDLEDSLVFNITSCFFAKMGTNICSTEDAVLLSPAEAFIVENHMEVQNMEEEINYEVITLKHAQLVSYHNCYIFSR